MKKILFLAVILLIALASCRRYQAFPPALVTYFPYTENQRLVYANDKGDTTCLTVKQMSVSDEHTESYCSKCGWNIAMEFKANNDSIYFNGYMTVSYSPYLILDAGGTYYYYDIPSDPFSEQIVSEIGDTIWLSKDGNEAIVVRYEGLVEFDDIQHNCTWTLVK